MIQSRGGGIFEVWSRCSLRVALTPDKIVYQNALKERLQVTYTLTLFRLSYVGKI